MSERLGPHRLQRLLDISRDLTSTMSLEPLLRKIVEAAVELTDVQAGVFIGATIHDVAQVVGAGYSISDEAGDTATLFKLMRVAMLLPVVVLLSVLFRGDGDVGSKRPPLLPGFLAAFVGQYQSVHCAL